MKRSHSVSLIAALIWLLPSISSAQCLTAVYILSTQFKPKGSTVGYRVTAGVGYQKFGKVISLAPTSRV